ncbi:MAG TPA: tetratricopeptide repeat protein [Vicinamibacterales bacterium]|nr:tetratricopeptide repeat protein [Vicinamibacterales bacterium]
MKRIERKHLKEDELAHTLRVAREFVEPRQQLLKQVGLAAIVVLVIVVAYGFWRERTDSRGQKELAEAMVALNAEVVPVGVQGADGVPAAASLGATGTFATEEAKLNAALPKLKAAADAYPSSPAGIQARYHMAGALTALGRHAEAINTFDEVIKEAGETSLYGQMAVMGKADAQSKGGQVDAAIGTLKGLAANAGSALPVDAVLMELARAYVQKGSRDDARKTFTEIVDKHPQSPYITEARAELENLKG